MVGAGEALGLTEDPLHTPIGEKLLEATDEHLISENWEANIAICDLVNSSAQGPGQAVRAIRKQLEVSAGKSPKSTLLTLTLLESCVKNCRREFTILVSSRDFAEFLLSRVISPQLEPGPDIQTKVLSLLQSWAHAFSHDPDLQGVAEVYIELKKKGIQFPVPSDDDLLLVQSMQPGPRSPSQSTPSSTPTPSIDSQANQSPTHSNNSRKTSSQSSMEVRPRRIPRGGKLTSDQVSKLGRDIQITQRHLAVFSELLSELLPGQEHPEDLEMLVGVAATSQEMQDRVVELLGAVQGSPEITAALLDINDKMNSEMERYKRYRAKCANRAASKKDPEAFSPDEVLLQIPASSSSQPPGPESRPISLVSQDSASAVKSGKEEDFQEIEAWMKENEGNEELMREFEQEALGDGATSQEFDKFLRKRSEAAQTRN